MIKKKSQSSIEFVIGFVAAILFLILSCNLFVWFNHCLVRRQRGYEDSRERATWSVSPGGQEDFYTPPKLNVFKSGGR
jgi:hypothetical protein